MSVCNPLVAESERGRSPLYDDALHGIYAFLTLHELVMASRTCRHWLTAGRKTQAHRPPSITCIWVGNLDAYSVSSFAKHTSPVQSLIDFAAPTNSHPIVTSSVVIPLYMRRSLRQLYSMAQCHSLTHIDLFGGTHECLDALLATNATWPHIRWINLSHSSIFEWDMGNMIRTCPNLTSLQPKRFLGSALPWLTRFERLTHLRLSLATTTLFATHQIYAVHWDHFEILVLDDVTPLILQLIGVLQTKSKSFGALKNLRVRASDMRLIALAHKVTPENIGGILDDMAAGFAGSGWVPNTYLKRKLIVPASTNRVQWREGEDESEV